MPRQRYVDISQWGEPYESGIFNRDYMGGLDGSPFSGSTLGEDEPPMTAAETTNAPAPPVDPTAPVPILPGAPTIPETTIYGQCDFSQGVWVQAVQAGLVQKGALAPGDAAAEQGYFGEKTCAAWTKLTGQPPDIASIAQSVLGPNESCASYVVPACAAEKKASTIGYGKILLFGVGLVGLVVVASRMRRRKS